APSCAPTAARTAAYPHDVATTRASRPGAPLPASTSAGDRAPLAVATHHSVPAARPPPPQSAPPARRTALRARSRSAPLGSAAAAPGLTGRSVGGRPP